MERLYDARGNRYLVASPAALARRGVPIPRNPADAAASAGDWAKAAIEILCRGRAAADNFKSFVCDGLLIGPFENAPPFNLIIVNTDGRLVERSGNGLTIFATALRDDGLAPQSLFDLKVHNGARSPLATPVEFGVANDTEGVWLSMGKPNFGPEAVGARPEAVQTASLIGVACSCVPALVALNGDWSVSQFVRVGNPHCVTILPGLAALPSWESLHSDGWLWALRDIADPLGDGRPGGLVCAAGVNLQWAARIGPDRIAARIFERGEGPTRSSGTSAVAVAAAALRLGLAEGPELEVVMLGGTAPVVGRFDAEGLSMRLFGVADRIGE